MSKQSKVPGALAGSLAALVMLAAGVSIQTAEPTPEALRNEYIQAVAADQTTSMAVKIAMVMGSQYESSGKHIGKPYVDKLMNLPDASFACGFLRVFGGHVDAVS